MTSEKITSGKITSGKIPHEKLTAAIAISFAGAYLYVCDGPDWFWILILISLTASAELLFSGIRRSAESFVWFACLTLCVISLSFCFRNPVYEDLFVDYDTVWDQYEVWLFAHFFAVWWVVSRSGKQLEGKTGRFFIYDFFGGMGRGFKNIFSRAAIIFSSVKSFFPVAVCAAVIGLFVIALSLLSGADTGFEKLIHLIAGTLNIGDDLLDVLLTAAVSLPVGAFVFGLIYGNLKVTGDELRAKREKRESFLIKIKKAPSGIFTAAIAMFSAAYLVFFIIQGSYLFGGFLRLLPEGFTLSHYARNGFFELCGIIAVNFSLLWLATRTVREEPEKSRTFHYACILLLIESLIFSAISFSKLYLYISCFGFTKLRFQSAWFTVVLAAASVLWIWNLITGRPAFRKWMYFSAVTLSLLTLF